MSRVIKFSVQADIVDGQIGENLEIDVQGDEVELASLICSVLFSAPELEPVREKIKLILSAEELVNKLQK